LSTICSRPACAPRRYRPPGPDEHHIATNFGVKALIAADSYSLREDVTPPACSKLLFASYPQAAVTVSWTEQPPRGSGLGDRASGAAVRYSAARLPEIILDASPDSQRLRSPRRGRWARGIWTSSSRLVESASTRAVCCLQLSDFKGRELEYRAIEARRAWFSPMPDGGVKMAT